MTTRSRRLDERGDEERSAVQRRRGRSRGAVHRPQRSPPELLASLAQSRALGRVGLRSAASASRVDAVRERGPAGPVERASRSSGALSSCWCQPTRRPTTPPRSSLIAVHRWESTYEVRPVDLSDSLASHSSARSPSRCHAPPRRRFAFARSLDQTDAGVRRARAIRFGAFQHQQAPDVRQVSGVLVLRQPVRATRLPSRYGSRVEGNALRAHAAPAPAERRSGAG